MQRMQIVTRWVVQIALSTFPKSQQCVSATDSSVFATCLSVESNNLKLAWFSDVREITFY